MNNSVILSRPYYDQSHVILNVQTGAAAPCSAGQNLKTKGNFHSQGGNNFALYVEDKVLYFQWNDRRWDLAAPETVVTYFHNFDARTTTFSVNENLVEYPAWWKGDPMFDPNLPELDEDEDYLGYIYAVKNDPELQVSLIQGWS